MNFTGERVVPDKMAIDPITYIEHLTRYVFSLFHCKDAKVLDASCGTGYGLEIISGVAREVSGIDISQDALFYAVDYYRFSHRAPRFKIFNLEKDDFSKYPDFGRFDVITSFETIEHLSSPDFFLQNVFKALRPGGTFIFSIPFWSATPYHKILYTLEGAQCLLARHFKDVEWYGQTLNQIGPVTPTSRFFIGVAHKPDEK
jgi:2-polyprenyl-3-methyl-5-hydroxy-6-metoxy-1,4-benzoquinol methylase